jgi:type I restriction enzyme S subunit
MGQAPAGTDCNKEGEGTIFVKAGEFSDVEPIVREWTTKPLKFAKKGDVLVCVVGATAGKINLGIDCAIGRSVAAVRPDTKHLDTHYLHYFLRTRTNRLRAASQGLALQLLFLRISESMGNHDSKIVDAGSVD